MNTPELELLQSKIEAILFVSNDPIPVERLSELLERDTSLVKKAIQGLKRHCQNLHRGIEPILVAGGYQFRTKKEYAEIIRTHLQEAPPQSLSPGMIEVLAIIAYRQPISRAEIEQIRGSNSFYFLSELFEAGFIEVIGKSQFEAAHLYRATSKFLLTFGLADFQSLPPLPKLDPRYPSSSDPSYRSDELDQLKTAIGSLLSSYPDTGLIPDPVQERRDQEILDQISKQISGIQTTTPSLRELG